MEPTLADLLSCRAEHTPESIAFIDSTQRITFVQAEQRAHTVSAHLADRGVGHGDRVILLAKNGEFLATSLFALWRIGAIAVVANWRLPVEELRYIVGNSEAGVILADEEFADRAHQLCETTESLEFLLGSGSESGASGYHDLISSTPRSAYPVGARASDPAVIMYTSGTTGRPKGAVLSHANMFWSAQGMTTTIEWEAAHRFLLVAPMFHIGGLAPLICNLLRGTRTVFMRDFDPQAVWKVIAEEKITTMMTVPLMLQAMLSAAQKTEVDTSSLVSVTCGGSAVPDALVRAFAALGVPVQTVYGITEFTGGVTFWTSSMGEDRAETQGKPVFGADVAVIDPQTGNALGAEETGELICHGPQRFGYYWNNDEATHSAITAEGWYRTGDIGRIDREGKIYVVDRLKDIIISGGENIYPAEIERVLIQHPGVGEAAVVGRPDSTWGEVPVAYIARIPPADIAEEDVFSYLREHLASYKIPQQIEFTEALPKNAVGKLLKQPLREKLRKETETS